MMSRDATLASVDEMGPGGCFKTPGKGVLVAIVSSRVDIFVGMVASMLKVDDWIANGF